MIYFGRKLLSTYKLERNTVEVCLLVYAIFSSLPTTEIDSLTTAVFRMLAERYIRDHPKMSLVS